MIVGESGRGVVVWCGTAGFIPHLRAVILGLSAIMHMSAIVFQIFKFAGVAYLLYLAWGMCTVFMIMTLVIFVLYELLATAVSVFYWI